MEKREVKRRIAVFTPTPGRDPEVTAAGLTGVKTRRCDIPSYQ
jgi:hypothetical protein